MYLKDQFTLYNSIWATLYLDQVLHVIVEVWEYFYTFFWRFSLIDYSLLVTLVRISFLVHLMWCQNLGLLAYNTEYVFIMYISRN